MAESSEIGTRTSRGRVSDGEAALDRALLALRWFALIAVLLLGFLDQTRGRLGLTTVEVALLVGVYYLALSLLVGQANRTVSLGAIAVLDAMVVSAADLIAGQSLSPIFLLYFPALIGAAVALSPADSNFLTLAISLLSTSIAVAHGGWNWERDQVQLLGIRLVALVLVGLVSSSLSQQLGLQRWNTEVERTAAARLTLLNDLLRATSSRLDLDRIMQTVVAMTRRGVGSDVAMAVLVAPGGDRQAWTSGDISPDALLDSGSQLTQRVARGGRPVLVQDITLQPEARRLSRLGLRSLLAAPLEADGKVLGVLFVGGRAPGAFGPPCLDWLQAIAQHAVLPIRNAHLRELERANASRLAELEQAKGSFLSSVSHDLRTPLTSIKVGTGLLADQREDWTDAERNLLASLRRNTERLEKLVDEVLDVTRLQSGAMRLRPEPLDLRGLIREVSLGIKPMLDARGQRLELALPEAPVEIWVDRRRLEQVLANLLSNSNKYSPEGSAIEVALEPGADGPTVSVSDEGPGIPTEDRPHVFEPFYRGARDDGARPGVGLGLAIASSIVALHGGRIWLAERPERGTTIAFHLPGQPCAKDEEEGAE